MDDKLNVITGASGLLGGYIAEQLVGRGEKVRAIVRSTSDTRFLESLGVALAVGELSDPQFVEDAIAGADVVYHCAAKTGNWGTWSQFHEATVVTTRNVVAACAKRDVGRLLHVSSVAAYGRPSKRVGTVTEEQPLGQNLWLWDYYNRSKIEAEQVVRRLGRRATVVRPTWIYGPRDVAAIPRIIRVIRKGGFWIIGNGRNLLNMGYAADVAEGSILAANHPAAAGEAYNLSGKGHISQRELVDVLCEWLEVPPVRRRIPRQVGHWAGFALEVWGRAMRSKRTPFISRHALSVFVRPDVFSSEKATRQLGWRPAIGPQEGLRRTLAWIGQAEHGGETVGPKMLCGTAASSVQVSDGPPFRPALHSNNFARTQP